MIAFFIFSPLGSSLDYSFISDLNPFPYPGFASEPSMARRGLRAAAEGDHGAAR